MSKANAEVTAARRAVLCQAVDYCCCEGGWTSIRKVHDTLMEWLDRGVVVWEKATWAWAAEKPYYGGTCQHLKAMARPQGPLERSPEGYRLKPAAAGGLRRRAVDVLRLKSEGKTLDEIAELLEISSSLAGSLADDPTGVKERERKRGYCGSCGAKKRRDATVCENCHQRKADELLPPDTFKLYLERAQSEGVEMIFGVTTELQRVIRAGTWRAYDEYEVPYELSWLDGLKEFQEAIGVELV